MLTAASGATWKREIPADRSNRLRVIFAERRSKGKFSGAKGNAGQAAPWSRFRVAKLLSLHHFSEEGIVPRGAGRTVSEPRCRIAF